MFYSCVQIANAHGVTPDYLPVVAGAAFGRLKDMAITALVIDEPEPVPDNETYESEVDDGEHPAGD